MGFFAFIFAVLAAVWTLLFGWQTVPYTERSQLIGVDADQSAEMGERAFDTVLSRSPVISDSDEAAAIRTMVARLADPADRLAEKAIDWDVVLIGDPSANAFALPNGNIAVHTGILPVIGTADGLAAVIAHEMAHIVARHPEERLTQAELARLGRLTASLLLGGGDPESQALINGILGLGSEYGLLRPFSRMHESEADRIGMIIMARACYDPRLAPRVWQDMAQASGPGLPEFFSTHPGHRSRFEELTAFVPEAMAARNEAGCLPLDGAAAR